MVISHAGVLDTQLPREESWEGEWERIFVKHRSWNFSIQQIWKWQMREKGGEGGELRYEHPRFFEKGTVCSLFQEKKYILLWRNTYTIHYGPHPFSLEQKTHLQKAN